MSPVVVNTNDVLNIDELLIWNILDDSDEDFITLENLNNKDCTIFLEKNEAETDKGRRTHRNWTDPEDESTIVLKVVYHDVEQDGVLIGIDKEWCYYKKSNPEEIGYAFRKHYKRGRATMEYEVEKRRNIFFSKLKSDAKTKGAGHYVDILYVYFKNEKQDFVETGSSMFSEAIDSVIATDVSTVPSEQQTVFSTVKTILGSTLPDSIRNVAESIKYGMS